MWNLIVCEVLCYKDSINSKYPCGKACPSVSCLGNGDRKCPYLIHSDSTPREASFFVPLYLIIWDKLVSQIEGIKSIIAWYLWDSLWFNRKKVKYLIETFSEKEKKAIHEMIEPDYTVEFAEWLKQQE